MSNQQDWFDDYMDYKMSSSGGKSPSGGHSGGHRVPTWVLIIIAMMIVSGTLPINGFTVLVCLVCAGIVLLRWMGA